MKIEPFESTEGNYEVVSNIYNAVWPDDPRTSEEIKKTDASLDGNYLFRRVVISKKGQIVAYAEYGQSPWAYHPRRFWFQLQVHPDHDARYEEIGRFYLDFLWQTLAERQPLAFSTRTRQDKTEAVRFLENEGFEVVMRSRSSELEVAGFDAGDFQEVIARVEGSGIRLLNLDEYRAGAGDWRRRIYDLHMEARRDTPGYDSSAAPGFEAYVERIFEAQEPLGPAWYLALDDELLVGLTMIFKNPAKPRMLRTGFTGVRRSHRRRGIATALKVKAIAAAQAFGAERIHTANAEGNPMYALNLTLGFRPLPAELDYRRNLDAAHNPPA